MKISQTLSQMLKAISGAFSAALAAFTVQVSTGSHHITNGGWIAVLVAFFGSMAAVYVTPNSPVANVITDIGDRLANVEAQLPNIPGISKAVVDGVVSGLQTLGQIVQAPAKAPEPLVAATKPDPAPVETPASLLASVVGSEVVPPVASEVPASDQSL